MIQQDFQDTSSVDKSKMHNSVCHLDKIPICKICTYMYNLAGRN